MTVDVVGLRDGEPIRLRWQLIALDGDGPSIPAIPARAIISRLHGLRPGARPCLCELSIAEFEAAMSGLAVRFDRREEPSPPLLQVILGKTWDILPDSIRRLHSVQDVESFSGRATITRGRGLIVSIIRMAFRFPPAGTDVPVTVTKQRTCDGEIWERAFNGRKFKSSLSACQQPLHSGDQVGLRR